MAGTENVTGTLRINGYGIKHRIGHLRSQETAPDQLIKLILLPAQRILDPFGIQFHVSGTDCFVGILGTGLGLEHMELAIVIGRSITGLDKVGSRCHCFITQTQGVGTHIGDQTESSLTGHIYTFIQLLGNSHSLLGGHTKLTGGLLLQR